MKFNLGLNKNNTTPFTPTGDYNPATKKYVDDNAGKVGTKQVDETAIGDDKILVYKTARRFRDYKL